MTDMLRVKDISPSAITISETTARCRSKGRSTLVCTAIVAETHDVKSFHLEADPPSLFVFKPGESIVLEFEARGEWNFRNYTIASSPTRPHRVVLTIKRDPDGLVSRFMHDILQIGDNLTVNGPAGFFNCVDIPPGNALMLSGGSGITPVMSMARWLCDTAQSTDVIFLHSARTPADIIFRHELDYMNRHFEGFRYSAICADASDCEGWTGATGLMDAALLAELAPDFMQRTVFCCGPALYMNAVKSLLRNAGFDMTRYFEESFTEGRVMRDADDPVVPEELTPKSLTGDSDSLVKPNPISTSIVGEGAKVVFKSSGLEGECPPGITILDMAHKLGIAVPTSCCMGLCGTCKTKLLEGEVDLPEREGLTDEELEDGYVLVCVGKPRGKIVLDL